VSNYTQSTNFATKDALSPGDPLKIVRGTEINTEFANIAVAVATKLDTTALASPGPIGATTPSTINATTGTFSGNVQMASANGGQLAGLRNKIINGDMRVSQRVVNPSTASLPSTGSATYLADRFFFTLQTAASPAAVTAGITNDNSLSGASGNHIYLTTNTIKSTLAAGDYLLCSQYIEGFNVADFKYGTAAAKTVTISFRAVTTNMGASSVISVSFRNNGTRSYVVPVTITNSAATYSVTIPGDTTGTWITNSGQGLLVTFTSASGSTFIAPTASAWQAGNYIANSTTSNFLGTLNGTLAITDIQIEVGPVATPFEQRPIGMELALCQRYYEVITSTGIIGSSSGVGALVGNWVTFSTPKRIIPTLSVGTATENTNLTATYLAPVNTMNFRYYGDATAAGPAYLTRTVNANAEL